MSLSQPSRTILVEPVQAVENASPSPPREPEPPAAPRPPAPAPAKA